MSQPIGPTQTDAGGYTPPPTKGDRAMSVVHHGDSISYNLAHARAHLEEAEDHARALNDRLAKKPTYRPHSRRIGR